MTGRLPLFNNITPSATASHDFFLSHGWFFAEFLDFLPPCFAAILARHAAPWRLRGIIPSRFSRNDLPVTLGMLGENIGYALQICRL
jgi:hypothetical protein